MGCDLCDLWVTCFIALCGHRFIHVSQYVDGSVTCVTCNFSRNIPKQCAAMRCGGGARFNSQGKYREKQVTTGHQVTLRSVKGVWNRAKPILAYSQSRAFALGSFYRARPGGVAEPRLITLRKNFAEWI